MLTDVGWRLNTGEPVSEFSAYDAVRDKVSLLEHVGAFEKEPRSVRSSIPTPQGQSLARAALNARE